MKVKALMYAFGEGSERIIDIPQHEWDAVGLDDRLGLAFKYGQNDFQPRKTYSVSVGDVVDLGPLGLHLVKSIGFRQIGGNELEQWTRVPQRDRHFHPWTTGRENETCAEDAT